MTQTRIPPQSLPTRAHAVVIDGITRTYKSRAGTVDALRGVTHTFAPQTFTAIMGPSGSGKSTLLQCAAGLDRPTRGRVAIGGIDLAGLSEVRLTELRRESMGFVFQAYNLLPALTAFDNVALPLKLAGHRPTRAQVMGALARVGLQDHHRRRPPELSGGQQQRVSIARALVTRPEVVFADEPTGALDRTTGRQVLELMRATVERDGLTVVMVTHDPVAASYADSVLFLEDGRLVGDLARADAAQIAAAMSELER
ncbi:MULTISPECIES: ABC transporter ATP-binding protein [unclassified Nocardioides]|uniref:ABC transporter ATP-binding protein n=1 Tax=unclassified Nocardioides TaxID=2615069 RepID=UPI0006F30FF2|nr:MULTISPECIES: ABC transporter ATP-binding protein [unclassified Nocardioides]KQY57099.1 ABC transporter [Nocardioides sp. Root140]KRF11739.1 ABC transporter [Nocardioides sp. Soil796]